MGPSERRCNPKAKLSVGVFVGSERKSRSFGKALESFGCSFMKDMKGPDFLPTPVANRPTWFVRS